MDNKIFIIHGSEIIRQGLFIIVKNIFGIESVLLDSPKGVRNYASISQSRIIFLIDAQLDPLQLTKNIESLHHSNSIKTILIRDRADQSNCDDNNECCFSLMDDTSKISDLLKSHLQLNNNTDDKKTSPWLTEREIEVVKLVAVGKTNKEIANELYISFHTVISHRKNITEKLGIKSISGLTVYAILNNLIDASNMDLE